MDATAKEILDCFLFEDVYNNRNPEEDEWEISFLGDNYLLLDRATGRIHNIKVQLVEGDLSKEEIDSVIKDQEWFEEYN